MFFRPTTAASGKTCDKAACAVDMRSALGLESCFPAYHGPYMRTQEAVAGVARSRDSFLEEQANPRLSELAAGRRLKTISDMQLSKVDTAA